uniref:Uncharacterized protein n=1 Tax=Anguilla anguilla TaxID=7936 RepID=A0A0E9TKZ4_ANGAN
MQQRTRVGIQWRLLATISIIGVPARTYF